MNTYKPLNIAERRRSILAPYSILHPFVYFPYWVNAKSFKTDNCELIELDDENIAYLENSDHSMIRVIFKQGIELRFTIEQVGITASSHYIVPNELVISVQDPDVKSFTREGGIDHEMFKVTGGLTLWEEMPFVKEATSHEIIGLLKWSGEISGPDHSKAAVIMPHRSPRMLIRCRFGSILIINEDYGQISAEVIEPDAHALSKIHLIGKDGILLSFISKVAVKACAAELNDRFSRLTEGRKLVMIFRKNTDMYIKLFSETFKSVKCYAKRITKGATSNGKQSEILRR
jgi:hypothetical protein